MCIQKTLTLITPVLRVDTSAPVLIEKLPNINWLLVSVFYNDPLSRELKHFNNCLFVDIQVIRYGFVSRIITHPSPSAINITVSKSIQFGPIVVRAWANTYTILLTNERANLPLHSHLHCDPSLPYLSLHVVAINKWLNLQEAFVFVNPIFNNWCSRFVIHLLFYAR